MTTTFEWAWMAYSWSIALILITPTMKSLLQNTNRVYHSLHQILDAANSGFNYVTESYKKWRTAFHVFCDAHFPHVARKTSRSGFWRIWSYGKPGNVIDLSKEWQQAELVSERYSFQGLAWKLAALTKIFLLPCEYRGSTVKLVHQCII